MSRKDNAESLGAPKTVTTALNQPSDKEPPKTIEQIIKSKKNKTSNSVEFFL